MRRRFLLSTAVVDLLSLMAAVVVGTIATFQTPWPWEVSLPGTESLWPLIGLMFAGAIVSSYASARAWAGAAPRPSYGRGLAIVLGSAVFTSVGLTLLRPYFSRGFFAITLAAWLAGVLAQRVVRRRRPWLEQMVVITTEKGLVDDLRNTPHADVLTVIDPGFEGHVEPLEAGVTLVVDLRAVLSDRMAQFVSSTNLAGMPVRALTSAYEEHTGRLPIVHLAEGWELSAPVLRTATYQPGKRFIDIIAVLATAPITLLLGVIIAVLVKTTSTGPVIFQQRRVGRHGGHFTLYKFRTMYVDAERNGPRFAVAGDDRLTNVGRFIRRFRADEIPQLWNVLRGDLSLVGPRPEQSSFVERFNDEIPFYSHRHLIRPGVTGWAQVNYGYADDQADTIEKLTYDLYYVKHMSPWIDVEILGRSVWTVLSGFGAR